MSKSKRMIKAFEHAAQILQREQLKQYEQAGPEYLDRVQALEYLITEVIPAEIEFWELKGSDTND